MSTDIVEQPNRPEGLTDKQARLAELVVLEGYDKAQAIELAGYASKSSGYATLRKPHVMDYITVLIREHLLDSSIKAAGVLRELMDNAKSDYVKLEASKDVLDRAGFKPIEKHAHLHGGQVSIRIEID